MLLRAGMLLLAFVANAPALPTLDIADRVKSFVRFYTDAQALDESARWELWRKAYGIAAVPPTPEGSELARRQLNEAWPRYAGLVPHLPALETEYEKAARKLFASANRLLGAAGTQVHTRVVLFVGQFDGNEFTAPAMNGQPVTVVMPVENPDTQVALAHELAHSVHFQLAGVRNSFGAPIGETIFLEGVAMHASRKLKPGLAESRYAEQAREPGWFNRCRANKDAVIQGILPYLDQSGPDVTTRFTFGQGTTGMDRELYCAAWFAVGDLLKSGRTFHDLARIPEHEMIATVRQVLTR
jgi:hypothetical protein